MEVGFATGGHVVQPQVRPRDTLPPGLYRHPLYQHPLDRYGAWSGGGEAVAVACGLAGNETCERLCTDVLVIWVCSPRYSARAATAEWEDSVRDVQSRHQRGAVRHRRAPAAYPAQQNVGFGHCAAESHGTSQNINACSASMHRTGLGLGLRVFQRTHSDGFRFDAQVAEETAESVEKATARASEEFAAELATLEAQVLGLKIENAALKDELNAETPDTSSVKRARS